MLVRGGGRGTGQDRAWARESISGTSKPRPNGLIKKDTLAPYLRKKNPKVLGEAKRGRKGHMTPMEEEVLIGTVMTTGRINDGDMVVKKAI